MQLTYEPYYVVIEGILHNIKLKKNHIVLFKNKMNFEVSN